MPCAKVGRFKGFSPFFTAEVNIVPTAGALGLGITPQDGGKPGYDGPQDPFRHQTPDEHTREIVAVPRAFRS